MWGAAQLFPGSPASPWGHSVPSPPSSARPYPGPLPCRRLPAQKRGAAGAPAPHRPTNTPWGSRCLGWADPGYRRCRVPHTPRAVGPGGGGGRPVCRDRGGERHPGRWGARGCRYPSVGARGRGRTFRLPPRLTTAPRYLFPHPPGPGGRETGSPEPRRSPRPPGASPGRGHHRHRGRGGGAGNVAPNGTGAEKRRCAAPPPGMLGGGGRAGSPGEAAGGGEGGGNRGPPVSATETRPAPGRGARGSAGAAPA